MAERDDEEQRRIDEARQRALEKIKEASAEHERAVDARIANRRKLGKLLGDGFAKDKPEGLPKPRWEELIRLSRSQILAKRMVERVRADFEEVGTTEIPEFHLVEQAIEAVLREGNESGDPFIKCERLNVTAWRIGVALVGVASYLFVTFLTLSLVSFETRTQLDARYSLPVEIIAGGDLAILSMFPALTIFSQWGWIKKRPWIWHMPFFSGGCSMTFIAHLIYVLLRG